MENPSNYQLEDIPQYQNTFYWHINQIQALTISEHKWKRILTASILLYSLFSLFYYLTMLKSLIEVPYTYLYLIIISTSVAISTFCVLFTLITISKKTPEEFFTLLEFWIALTLLLMFLVVFTAQKIVVLKTENRHLHALATEKNAFNSSLTFSDDEINVFRDIELINNYKILLSKSADKDEDTANRRSLKDHGRHSKLKGEVKKIIYKFISLGCVTLTTQCSILFLIHKIYKILQQLHQLHQHPVLT